MRKWAIALLLLAVSSLAASPRPVTTGYSGHELTRALIDKMVVEHGFDRTQLERQFAQVEYKQSIIDAMERPAEKVKEWGEYRKIFITERRISEGVDFWRSHAAVLARAEQQYGVNPALIVAIIGVETHYGRITGSYRVIDALSTLAFDYPKRSEFFTRELEQFLILTREQQRDPLTLTGSYAGAMGYGQFMPSSYRQYAVDFDGDGIVDIWENPDDAIGSVANYMLRHGWQPGQSVAVRARTSGAYNAALVNKLLVPELTLAELRVQGFAPVMQGLPADTRAIPLKLVGDYGVEFWLGLPNFYAITRYNHSYRYAMAVTQLSEAIADRLGDGEG